MHVCKVLATFWEKYLRNTSKDENERGIFCWTRFVYKGATRILNKSQTFASLSNVRSKLELFAKNKISISNWIFIWITLNGRLGQIRTNYFRQTSEGTSWTYENKNSWIRFLDNITALHAIPELLSWCLWNQETRTKKKEKKLSAHFRIFLFPFVAILSHLYEGWVAAALACLEDTELLSEKPGVQGFRAKSRVCAAKPPRREFRSKNLVRQGPPVQQFRFNLKALIDFFRTRYKSFVGLEQFIFCDLKFKHQIFGWLRKLFRPFKKVPFFTLIQIAYDKAETWGHVLPPMMDE